jgi:hypothetical protein
MPANLRRIDKYMLDVEHIDHISDEMRAVVESEWPELAHKLPLNKQSRLAAVRKRFAGSATCRGAAPF